MQQPANRGQGGYPNMPMMMPPPWAPQYPMPYGYPGYYPPQPVAGNTIKVHHESHLFPDAQVLKDKQRKVEEYRSDEARLKRKKDEAKRKEEVKKNMKTVGIQADVAADKKRREELKKLKAAAKNPPPFDFSKIGISHGGNAFGSNLYSQSPYPPGAMSGISANPSIYPVTIAPLDAGDKSAQSPAITEDLIHGTYKVWKVFTLLKFWENHQTRCKVALKNQYFADYYKKDGNAFLDQSIEMIRSRIRLILGEVLQEDQLDLSRDSLRLEKTVTLILDEFDDICSASSVKKFDNLLVLSFLSNVSTSGAHIPAKGFLTKYVMSRLSLTSAGQLQ